MTSIKALCLFGILTAITHAQQPAVQPVCNAGNATIFTGALNDDVLISENWANGLPRSNRVACFPPEAAELAATLSGMVRILELRIA